MPASLSWSTVLSASAEVTPNTLLNSVDAVCYAAVMETPRPSCMRTRFFSKSASNVTGLNPNIVVPVKSLPCKYALLSGGRTFGHCRTLRRLRSGRCCSSTDVGIP